MCDANNSIKCNSKHLELCNQVSVSNISMQCIILDSRHRGKKTKVGGVRCRDYQGPTSFPKDHRVSSRADYHRASAFFESIYDRPRLLLEPYAKTTNLCRK